MSMSGLEKSERPWGRYEVLQESATHKVKCIWMKPGTRISYQRHKHRAEHWFIVQGTGEVTTVLQITNAADLKATVTNDRKALLKTKAYSGVALSLAPGIGDALSSLLGLSAGTIPENLAFATADVSLYSAIKAKR